MNNSRNCKLASLILISIFIIAGLILYFGVMKSSRSHRMDTIKINGTILMPPQPLSAFTFTDQAGKLFTKDSMKGHWTMMFFGFTNCGMVCPTSMAALSQTYRLLQNELPDKQLPLVVFVTVDPDRDTATKMKAYINAFNPHFIGVRADITETVALEKQLHIAAAKIEADGKGKNHYTIEHTADILLFNPDAELQAIFSFPPKPEQLAKDYKQLLMARTR